MPNEPNPSGVLCWHIRVTGLVQGVSFRAYAAREARRLHLVGSVRNQPDGSVAIIAQGDADHLERFRQWCEQGSPQAHVEQVEVTPGDLVDAEGFAIERSGQ